MTAWLCTGLHQRGVGRNRRVPAGARRTPSLKGAARDGVTGAQDVAHAIRLFSVVDSNSWRPLLRNPKVSSPVGNVFPRMGFQSTPTLVWRNVGPPPKVTDVFDADVFGRLTKDLLQRCALEVRRRSAGAKCRRRRTTLPITRWCGTLFPFILK